MPILIAGFLRFLVQNIVAFGMTWVASKLLDQIVVLVMKAFGATQEQAEEFVGNAIYQTAVSLGFWSASFMTKIPQNVAKRLKLTTGGGSTKGPATIKGTTIPIIGTSAKITAAQGTVMLQEAAPSIVARLGTSFAKVMKAAQYLATFLNLGFVPAMVLLNAMDHGGFNSQYQEWMQKVLSLIGIEPDKPFVKSQILSDDAFKKLYATYKETGAKGITNPQTGEVLEFTRDNLARITDAAIAPIVLENGSITFKQALGVVSVLLSFDKAPAVIAGVPVGTSAASAGGTSSSVKVFAGIVSQGTLGAGLSFIPRPDDLIESPAELKDAAANNLASYLSALPGKIIYEIKIVNSVVTKDGFRQVGASQNIQVGTDAAGNPRYKKVVNKFATLTLYILTDRGTRTKLTTITLGPTNVLKFNPRLEELAVLEKNIQSSIFTTDLNAIRGVEKGGQVISTQPTLQFSTSSPNPQPFVLPPGEPIYTGSSSQFGANSLTQFFTWGGKPYSFVLDTSAIPPGSIPDSLMRQKAEEAVRLAWSKEQATILTPDNFAAQIGVDPSRINRETGEIINPTDAEIAAFNAAFNTYTPTGKGATATSLFEWYGANGQQLPTVEVRSRLYEQAGLGLAAMYTGTAEQNTRLLNALKSGAASPNGSATERIQYSEAILPSRVG